MAGGAICAGAGIGAARHLRNGCSRWERRSSRSRAHRSDRASPERRAHGAQEARRLLVEGMAVAGLSVDDMKKLPGSDPRKVAIARLIWEQTAVGMAWLAAHLHLRSAANASQQIRRHRQQPPKLSKARQRWMLQSKMLPAPYFRVLTVSGAAGVKVNS